MYVYCSWLNSRGFLRMHNIFFVHTALYVYIYIYMLTLYIYMYMLTLYSLGFVCAPRKPVLRILTGGCVCVCKGLIIMEGCLYIFSVSCSSAATIHRPPLTVSLHHRTVPSALSLSLLIYNIRTCVCVCVYFLSLSCC